MNFNHQYMIVDPSIQNMSMMVSPDFYLVHSYLLWLQELLKKKNLIKKELDFFLFDLCFNTKLIFSNKIILIQRFKGFILSKISLKILYFSLLYFLFKLILNKNLLWFIVTKIYKLPFQFFDQSLILEEHPSIDQLWIIL